ncbi:MAG: HAD family hydrolase [Candidatus Moranbacteria bacterium]|nr:HAD family hydrolase [Candidatus Moranbacteria bacterium]
MEKKNYIFFDFDGVLHNTFFVHLREIRKFSNIDLTEQEYRDLHNGNFFENREEKLKNFDWNGYRDYVHSRISSLTMEKRIKNVLETLAKKYAFAIVSASGEKILEEYIKHNDLSHFFSDILGGDFHHSKEVKFNHLLEKYNLSLDDVLFVTDTLGDILEAHKVGIRTIAVTFGFHKRELLLEGNPFACIDTPEELLHYC